MSLGSIRIQCYEKFTIIITANADKSLADVEQGIFEAFEKFETEGFGAVSRVRRAPGDADSLEALIPAALRELGQ